MAQPAHDHGTQPIPVSMAQRRWPRHPLLLAGSVVLALAVGLLVGAVLPSGSSSASTQPVEQGESSAAAAQSPKTHRARKRHRAWGRLKQGQTLLIGTVSSVDSGSLTVTKDGDVSVRVTTDSSTKVRGSGERSLSALKPGQRVVVKVDSGKAVAVAVPRAHAAGTVTAIDGDQATLVEPDGLTMGLNLSSAAHRPANGDVVLATGSAASGGTTLKVSTVRELPHAG